MPTDLSDIEHILGSEGLLAQQLDGFAYRTQQVEMAQAVMLAMSESGKLIAEAGTGTGKTYAYLTPALLSGLKVIISTGTRNLQDQLYLRDLPKLRTAMASAAKVALLKGRANYLCIYRMDMALLDARGQRKHIAQQLIKVRDWSHQTERGDIAELSQLPEDAEVWPLVTSTTDNCLGQTCPSWKDCHLVEARRQAQEADIVVINHHLLCADFAIKQGGFGEILPAADVFILDEAHQMPDVASNFFGESLSTRHIMALVQDTLTAYHAEAGDFAELPKHLEHVKKAIQDLRLSFGQQPRRGAWEEIAHDSAIQQALDDMHLVLNRLTELLTVLEDRGKGLDNALARCIEISQRLQNMYQPDTDTDTPQTPMIRWFETFAHSLRLQMTPLDIATLFHNNMLQHAASWIFTSATLAVGDDFSHFQQALGLDEVECKQWESPFDFQRQALWYVPRNMPEPHEASYITTMLDKALPLIEANQGRAFLLFTSYRALYKTVDWLQEKNLPYPLMVQGTAPKAELIERFVKNGNALLLGTASFWEGVDVRGATLSLIIIDKLPFASPGDPVLQARLDAIKARGGNPFINYQVPQAAIALKQGAGRLIRDVTDKGVFMLCDPRLLKKSYGRAFLAAMPNFLHTRDPKEALSFIQNMHTTP